MKKSVTAEMKSAPIRVLEPGRISYPDGMSLQEQARDRVLAGGPDELLLLEHDPVVTLGRRGGLFDGPKLAALNTPVVDVDRGGEATWHGPGQLVGYPIIDLRRARLDVPTFVRQLGELLTDVAQEFRVTDAVYDACRPGIYVEGRKIGAIGLHIHRGVTTHGFALNVSCSLEGFSAITPCGMAGLVSTSLSQERGDAVPLDAVRDAVKQRVASGWLR